MKTHIYMLSLDDLRILVQKLPDASSVISASVLSPEAGESTEDIIVIQTRTPSPTLQAFSSVNTEFEISTEDV